MVDEAYPKAAQDFKARLLVSTDGPYVVFTTRLVATGYRVFLDDRSDVAALVGQLQSWLARAEAKP